MSERRSLHYILLIAVTGLLTLPMLGSHALWDMDEGVNVGCSREMLEGGTWVVPTFNWELRTAKPIFLYWLQRFSFLAFGISEWSARLPSVLLGIGSVLVTYEIGRRMFGPATGLLAGIVLASSVQFCLLSHAATPDAPLIFFSTLTFYLFWVGQLNGSRNWLIWPAAASGLAVLSKGPVGLALPGLVVLVYFAWNRELKRVVDHRLLYGILIWGLVAIPWYAVVAAETRGEYIRKFLGYENVSRFTTAMEGHKGPPFYYILALFVFFAPWCCFLGVTLWHAAKQAGRRLEKSEPSEVAEPVRAQRFLLSWFLSYLIFFSIAATKLPNYIAPLYPALALMTARLLIQWRDSQLSLPRWVMPLAALGYAIVGLATIAGLLVAGGTIPLELKGLRTFPGLGIWSLAGLIPLAGAVMLFRLSARDQRHQAVNWIAAVSVGWVAVMAAGPPVVIDRQKAAKELALTSGATQPERDIRLGSLQFFPESLAFYTQRRVERLHNEQEVIDFLASPGPVYLFIPASLWELHFEGKIAGPVRITARIYDFYRNEEVLVVTNDF